MRISQSLLLLTLSAVSAVACTKTPSESGGVTDKTAKVHRISDFNKEDEGLDSHMGVEGRSTLEPIYEYQQVIPTALLGCTKPIYPRVKKCADGSYIMLYQQDQVAFYGNYAEFATAQANVENAVTASSADRVVMAIASNECTEDLTDAVNDVLLK